MLSKCLFLYLNEYMYKKTKHAALPEEGQIASMARHRVLSPEY